MYQTNSCKHYFVKHHQLQSVYCTQKTNLIKDIKIRLCVQSFTTFVDCSFCLHFCNAMAQLTRGGRFLLCNLDMNVSLHQSSGVQLLVRVLEFLDHVCRSSHQTFLRIFMGGNMSQYGNAGAKCGTPNQGRPTDTKPSSRDSCPSSTS